VIIDEVIESADEVVEEIAVVEVVQVVVEDAVVEEKA
jgi:hypothetical protein